MNRISRGSIALLTLLALFAASNLAFGGRTAPNGTLTPRRGPYAGQVCKYGDGSHQYTQLAEFTVAELEDFISGKKKPPRGARGEFSLFFASLQERDYDFGSQLSREGYDRYRELVQACLEDGQVNVKAESCRHRAPKPIGISIYTGKPVAEYEMTINHSGYWVIEPGWVK